MGTTSFRTADFNQKIERQLTLLSKFWEVHTDVVWSGNDEIQSLYYDFMKDNDFLTGDAPNKPKDAREKTSGLIDLGLIDNERRPTAAGESLRQITSNGDFRPNNLLQIPADSYIYFKQMLKTSNDVDGEIVRPFVVLVLALKQLEYLTQEEFTYLLPLITTSRKFRTIVDCIKRLRKGDITIDEIIVDTLLSMENYREARLYLLLSDIRTFLDDERHERFNRLIDARFPDHVLLELLSDFETRNDINIRRLVTDNADVPTIFEYIVGIVWYKVSNRKGRILDYFNLSLDADLLPKTHAAGGMEDITYRYNATPGYPEHTLLIEATLAEANAQRRMEMEPVSRHLGDFLLRDNRQEAYALFVTTFLHLNVISDFRGRKQMPYYSSDGEQCINGMKIIPLNIAELKNIIANSMTYDQLYPLFECAHQNNEPPKTWYENNIMRSLQPKKPSTGILGTLF